MPLHDILVHVTQSVGNKRSLEMAFELARSQSARLTGLYVRPYPVVVPVAPIGGAIPIIDGLVESYRAASDQAEKQFRSIGEACAVPHNWHDDDGDAAGCIAFHGRYTDLVVIGQKHPDDQMPELPGDMAALVTMGSGRPILALPFAGTLPTRFERIMVCWNATREASRATHDALSSASPGAHVDVVCIDPEDTPDRIPGSDIAAHLARHGLSTKTHRVASSELNIADTILSTSADLGSDLIVMGAYGHARLLEIALGGATRSILQHLPAPVLMSH